MKRWVVLGGGGVFGIHTASWLLDNADPECVVSVGRNPEKPEPFSLNVGKGDPRYAYHQIHVGFEIDRLMELLDAVRPDVIVCYAAQGERAASWKYSWRFFDTNATALVRLAEELMARDYLERFIQIGASEVYGSVDEPVTEDFPMQPTSPYAASKAAFDMYLLSVADTVDFPMNIIRPSNAYAPGQLLHRVIPRAIVAGLTGRKLPLQGGGRAEKSYLHARDLGHAVQLVAEKAPLGKIYNVGPPSPISIRELVEKIAAALDIPFDELCEVVPDRLGEDSRYWLDSSAIRKDAGWQPQVTLEEGLAEMVAWGRRYLDQLRDVDPTYVLKA